MVGTKGVFSQWHDLLGWYTPNSNDFAQTRNIPLIKKQFHLLWSLNCLKILLSDVLMNMNQNFERIEFVPPASASATNLFRRALERKPTNKLPSKNAKSWRKSDSPEVVRVSEVCAMYYHALTTLSQLRLDILSSISFNNTLYDMWLLISSFGPNCGLKEFYEVLKTNPKGDNPKLLMLILFCDAITHYVT